MESTRDDHPRAIYSLTPALLSNGGTPRKSVIDASAAAALTARQDHRLSDENNASAFSANGEDADSNRNLLAVDTGGVPATESSAPIEDSDPIEPNKFNNQLHKNKISQQRLGKSKKDSGAFPIPLALALLILWIAFSAGMFCLWETDWGYLTSVYFFFVSISTVGLGDIVPTKPDMMFINFMLILIGLALLSMCINLIQDSLERLIEQLIEEYIDEIEKIAAVVTNNEEFAEEAPMPFEVGMTSEMLTVPLTTIADEKAHVGGGTWRVMKDWMAERIASNVLISRLDTSRFSDESSSSSESEESDVEEDHRGLVHRMEDGSLPRHAKISVISGLGRDESGGVAELPIIEVHEGTPVSSRANDHIKDGVSFSTERRRSRRKKHRATIRAAGALSNFSKSTMRTIQAIETAKMCIYRDNDFKSRLFAKFATNERLTHLVDDHIVSAAHAPAAKMVSAGSQTTPPPTVITPSRANDRIRSVCVARHFNFESMDSTSSDVEFTNGGNTDWISSSFDADSLYSAGYFDMSFGGYSTDSVPRLMADPNTPVPGAGLSNEKPLLFPTDAISAARTRQRTIFPVPQCFTHLKRERVSALAAPTTPIPSPTIRHRNSNRTFSGRNEKKEQISNPLLLGSIPLHHRALSAKRRYSDNDCLSARNSLPRAIIHELYSPFLGQSMNGTKVDVIGMYHAAESLNLDDYKPYTASDVQIAQNDFQENPDFTENDGHETEFHLSKSKCTIINTKPKSSTTSLRSTEYVKQNDQTDTLSQSLNSYRESIEPKHLIFDRQIPYPTSMENDNDYATIRQLMEDLILTIVKYY